MFTWSVGCPGLSSPFLPPSATFARLAMTSLVFMLWEVPAPAWNRSTTNSSWYWPAIIASAASTIDMARRRGRALDADMGDNEVGIGPPAGNREIFHRPRRLYAIPGIGRHRILAQRVFFGGEFFSPGGPHFASGFSI